MILLENKKVRFDYEILEELNAGMILEGWEVKSIRAKHANLRSAWVSIDKDDQVWLKTLKSHSTQIPMKLWNQNDQRNYYSIKKKSTN